MARGFVFHAMVAAGVCFLSLKPALGQVVVEESVTTDTVDLFAKKNAPQKSGILAMTASILLPGLGQQYLGQKEKALAYFSAEALFIFGAVFCDRYSQQIFNNAKSYAWEHANALYEGWGTTSQTRECHRSASMVASQLTMAGSVLPSCQTGMTPVAIW